MSCILRTEVYFSLLRTTRVYVKESRKVQFYKSYFIEMVEINLSFPLIFSLATSKPRLPFLEYFTSKVNSKSNYLVQEVTARKKLI